jgi:hypothetical protein
MAGVWGAAAAQKALGALRWREVDGAAVPVGIVPGRIDALVRFALGGEVERGSLVAAGAADALGDYLQVRGWEMPASLAEWVRSRRSGEFSIKRRGAAPWGHAERDKAIYERMAKAQREGRAAYSAGKAERRRSECSEAEIIAAGEGMTVDAVEKIFDRMKKPDPRLIGD